MSDIDIFQQEHPSLESFWRSIILFGRNVASYKFALSKSILELISSGKNKINIEDLALPYAKHICEHLTKAPKQSTSATSAFLEACKKYNEGNLSHQDLLDITVNKGFTYVLDAFHIVNNQNIPIPFFQKDFTASSKRIILTDDLFKLREIKNFNDLLNETEARWNLVETAWDMGISRNLLNVQYDNAQNVLFVENPQFKRRDITSARDALNGYQNGRCFYCFDHISLKSGLNSCDIDHFFPHTLQPFLPESNLDGVWNLVLACPKCNRGSKGKFAKVPHLKYLNRLSKRNEFLISSHHPLRETLMKQTGQNPSERVAFLKEIDKNAINLLIHRWETTQLYEDLF